MGNCLEPVVISTGTAFNESKAGNREIFNVLYIYLECGSLYVTEKSISQIISLIISESM